MEQKLDATSSKFNPLAALYCKDIRLPVKNAPILDNVAKFESLLSKCSEDEVVKEVVKRREEEKAVPSTSSACIAEPVVPVSDTPTIEIETQAPKGEKKQNVVSRMEQCRGPLAYLKKCMDNRIKVKILTRNESEVRGYCLGFIVAFDNHWNLALENVQEVWTRKRKRKTLPLAGIEAKPFRREGDVLTPPKIEILKKGKTTETCQRYIKQILLRGEHVVSVSADPPLSD